MRAGENSVSAEKGQLSIYREIKTKSTLIIAVHKNSMNALF